VIFTLRPQARWHDGTPVTADDVIWTFDTLRTKGQPAYRAYYANVAGVEKVGERAVKFTFKPGENRELPLIVGQLPVLPKHYWEGHDFTASTLEPPLGSGPYKIDQFEPGRWSTYRRVPDYWGKDLAVNRGRNNVDVIRRDYYRDMTVALEARPALTIASGGIVQGLGDGDDVPAVRDACSSSAASRTVADRHARLCVQPAPAVPGPCVRQAPVRLDFEWSNRTLFYGQYTRARSY
jgi:microcin C transport system substrate-binding protein